MALMFFAQIVRRTPLLVLFTFANYVAMSNTLISVPFYLTNLAKREFCRPTGKILLNMLLLFHHFNHPDEKAGFRCTNAKCQKVERKKKFHVLIRSPDSTKASPNKQITRQTSNIFLTANRWVWQKVSKTALGNQDEKTTIHLEPHTKKETVMPIRDIITSSRHVSRFLLWFAFSQEDMCRNALSCWSVLLWRCWASDGGAVKSVQKNGWTSGRLGPRTTSSRCLTWRGCLFAVTWTKLTKRLDQSRHFVVYKGSKHAE